MSRAFSAAERARIAASLGGGEDPACPACGGRLDVRSVEKPADVAYVRHRVWALCGSCRRSGAVDVSEAGRP